MVAASVAVTGRQGGLPLKPVPDTSEKDFALNAGKVIVVCRSYCNGADRMLGDVSSIPVTPSVTDMSASR